MNVPPVSGSVSDIATLTARWGRAPGVSFAQMFGGTVAILESASSRAVVALQGGQVLSWRAAHDTNEALWLSPVADLSRAKAVRGGIPICWPWFGPHSSDPLKPPHGFVRAAPWGVTGSASSATDARLVLAFDAADAAADVWPHRARAEIEITAGETLTIALTTHNLGPSSFPLTEALHTYLRVGDITAVRVEGLSGRTYVDQMLGAARALQDGEPVSFTSETDRVYLDTPDVVTVRDPVFGREIRVAKSGSLSTVVWNPWINKSMRLGDMGDDGYKQMLCVETANAFDNAVTVEPGAHHRMTTEISVRSL